MCSVVTGERERYKYFLPGDRLATAASPESQIIGHKRNSFIGSPRCWNTQSFTISCALQILCLFQATSNCRTDRSSVTFPGEVGTLYNDQGICRSFELQNNPTYKSRFFSGNHEANCVSYFALKLMVHCKETMPLAHNSGSSYTKRYWVGLCPSSSMT